jgi:hypothetical protein
VFLPKTDFWLLSSALANGVKSPVADGCRPTQTPHHNYAWQYPESGKNAAFLIPLRVGSCLPTSNRKGIADQPGNFCHIGIISASPKDTSKKGPVLPPASPFCTTST